MLVAFTSALSGSPTTFYTLPHLVYLDINRVVAIVPLFNSSSGGRVAEPKPGCRILLDTYDHGEPLYFDVEESALEVFAMVHATQLNKGYQPWEKIKEYIKSATTPTGSDSSQATSSAASQAAAAST